MRRLLVWLCLTLFLVIASIATWLYSRIDGSLAKLDGQVTLYGLNQQVTVQRDQFGVATFYAEERLDLALATGFIHAQERFFQMDLNRRRAAGEFSSLFGLPAIKHDKQVRIHRFRDRARRILNQLPKAQTDLINAYTRGVNLGLANMKAPPPEYILLDQEPVKWRDEDSVLAIFNLYLELQGGSIERERNLAIMQRFLTPEQIQFLVPDGSEWDAALDDSVIATANYPTAGWPTIENNAAVNLLETHYSGSNSWAIGPFRAANSRAIIANDMHLRLTVPGLWYRAQFNYWHNNRKIKITGATLPGLPFIVVGSNQSIAWGFTNSYADLADVIAIDYDVTSNQFSHAGNPLTVTTTKELIAVNNAPAIPVTILETDWGPIIDSDDQGRALALQWVAHDLQAINFQLQQFETAQSVTDAIDIANQAGMPTQNLTVVDRQGNIGWTLMGPLPDRRHLLTTAANKNELIGWTHYLPAEDYPSMINPTSDALWSANARMLGGDAQLLIGNGGYALGARAQQIKQRLLQYNQADEQALFDLGFDNQALFLSRWQKWIQQVVLPNIADMRLRQRLIELLDESPLLASKESTAYPLVKQIRQHVINRTMAALMQWLKQQDNDFDPQAVSRFFEVPVWQLIHQQPQNFPIDATSWADLFQQAISDALLELEQHSGQIDLTWGQINSSRINHPLSSAVSWLAPWLNMPQVEQAGDTFMPYVQAPAFGASQRMVVSPGFEQDGIFVMPAGQSGHFWSPFYRAGHDNWQQGQPQPFLPGTSRHTLVLNAY